jgi:hypothetical protein
VKIGVNLQTSRHQVIIINLNGRCQTTNHVNCIVFYPLNSRVVLRNLRNHCWW